MQTDEVAGPVLFLAVIVSTFLWTIVYFASWMIFPQKKAFWHCYIVVFIHGVVTPTLSYVFQMRMDPWPFTHPGK